MVRFLTRKLLRSCHSRDGMSCGAQFGRVMGLVVLLCLGVRSAAAQLSSTNAVAFFSTVSAKFLQAEFGLNLDQIQIHPTNKYSPAIHRVLQVAANLWETTRDGTNQFPTVFRPRFTVTNNAVFLSGHVLVTNKSEVDALPLLDLTTATNVAAQIPPSGDALVFGVPLVIGARKGVPNFNELAAELLFSISRKLQVRKVGDVIVETNQAFVMEVTMPIGVEFWNSYATNYNQPVSIFVTNYTTMSLTNDLGVSFTKEIVAGDQVLGTNDWRGYKALTSRDPKSFITMLRTNLALLPPVQYMPNLGAAGFYATNANVWDKSQQLLMPRWGIAITNCLCAIIVAEPGKEIIDQVVLSGMNYVTNLTDIVASMAALSDAQFGDNGGTPGAFKQLWITNQLGVLLSGRSGAAQQINISVGAVPLQGAWNFYGSFSPSPPTQAIVNFNYFMFTANTSGIATVPFTPVLQFRVPLSWQANDPLVHSFASELYDRERSGIVVLIDPAQQTLVGQLPGLGAKNVRYQPWPIDSASLIPDAYNPALKDPLVRASDDWSFPTGQPLALEYLGRVHRGTPWQTLYLKSSDMGLTNPVVSLALWMSDVTESGGPVRWSSWTGGPTEQGFYTRPVRDRSFIAAMATLLVTNHPTQLLSINSADVSQWRAVLDGLTVLTNTSVFTPTYDTLTLNSNSAQVADLIQGVSATRAGQPNHAFHSLGDMLATPELSLSSPWLDRSGQNQLTRSITDEAYEKLPSQLLSLVRADSEATLVSVHSPWQIRFTGSDNYPYVVEWSTNLLNWTAVSTNYPTNSVFIFTDGSVQSPRSFYRSVLLP